MGGEQRATGDARKKMNATTREMTTAVLLLRAAEVGISIADLDLLTIGMLNDIFVEKFNDSEGEYDDVATQEDIDTFLR